MDEPLQLGGNIELRGFREFDGDSMIVLKKIVGNYVRKFNDLCERFEHFSITMKPVGREGSEIFEMHAKLMDNGQVYTSEMTDRNAFVVLDNVCKKIEGTIRR